MGPDGPGGNQPADPAQAIEVIADEGKDADSARADGTAPVEAEDPGLGSVSFPTAAVRRIAKSVAPNARFTSEAIACLQRIAQAYVCFATDRALRELRLENERAMRKIKGKPDRTVRKTLGVDHVMRFIAADMPQIATKVAALFPYLMPSEFKPPAVRLLEQLHEQNRRDAADAAAAPGATVSAAGAPGDENAPAPPKDLFSAFLANVAARSEGAEAAPPPNPCEQADASAVAAGDAADAADEEDVPARAKRPQHRNKGEDKASRKRARVAPDAVQGPAAQQQAVKSAATPMVSLHKFFGRSAQDPQAEPSGAASASAGSGAEPAHSSEDDPGTGPRADPVAAADTSGLSQALDMLDSLAAPPRGASAAAAAPGALNLSQELDMLGSPAAPPRGSPAAAAAPGALSLSQEFDMLGSPAAPPRGAPAAADPGTGSGASGTAADTFNLTQAMDTLDFTADAGAAPPASGEAAGMPGSFCLTQALSDDLEVAQAPASRGTDSSMDLEEPPRTL